MKKVMSIFAVTLMMAGSTAIAGSCGGCGSDKDKDKDKDKQTACGETKKAEKAQHDALACGGSKKVTDKEKTA